MTLRISHILFAAALATLGGCATYQPRPLDPHAELLALRARDIHDLPVERRDFQTTRMPPPAFDPSDGLDESELASIALTLNPQLHASRLEIGLAEAQLISAGTLPNPELGLGLRGGVSGPSGTAFDADLLFELLRSRERSTRRQIAATNLAEAHARILADELDLIAQVRSQHLAVLVAARQLELLEEELALRQRILDMTRQRRQLGEGTELDIAATQLELADTQRALRKARAEQASSKRRLNQLLGLPPAYDLALAAAGKPLAVILLEDPTDEDLDHALLAGHPQLRARHADYQRAEHELRLAILNQFPRLRLGPAVERELDGNWSAGIGLSLELPVFDRNQGEIAEMTSRREQSRQLFIAAMHALRAEAHDARSILRFARDEIDQQTRELSPLIQRNQELFDGALRAGELSILDALAARQRLLESRRAILQSVVEYREALIRLETAIGRTGLETGTRP